MASQEEEPSLSPSSSQQRRSLLTRAAAGVFTAATAITTVPPIATADTGAEVRGIEVTPFNGLIFNYRGSEFGGISEDDLDEPSVSYAEFMTRLKKGEVAFVEFLAPDGDAAYATFKSGSEGGSNKPIRIGEGETKQNKKLSIGGQCSFERPN